MSLFFYLYLNMYITDIFFDLDRTLWDFDLNAENTLVELCKTYDLLELGIKTNEFIKSYTLHNERLWSLYRENKIKKEDLRSERFNLTLNDFSVSNKELAIKLGEDYVNKCPLQTKLFPNTFEILNYLKNKYKLHIITNGFEEVQNIKLKTSKLISFFDKIITSEKVNAKKPDPKIFKYALEQINVEAENTIMIGDDLPVDIIGAKNVGMHQIYFNPKNEKHSHEVDYEIKNLIEIKEIL